MKWSIQFNQKPGKKIQPQIHNVVPVSTSTHCFFRFFYHNEKKFAANRSIFSLSYFESISYTMILMVGTRTCYKLLDIWKSISVVIWWEVLYRRQLGRLCRVFNIEENTLREIFHPDFIYFSSSCFTPDKKNQLNFISIDSREVTTWIQFSWTLCGFLRWNILYIFERRRRGLRQFQLEAFHLVLEFKRLIHFNLMTLFFSCVRQLNKSEFT